MMNEYIMYLGYICYKKYEEDKVKKFVYSE